jgi:hypothetical protein
MSSNKPSIAELRRRKKKNQKRKHLKEPEEIESFEEFQKKMEAEREDGVKRAQIHDPLEDEKLVQKWMNEEEIKKKKRMSIANEGGRNRPLHLNSDFFYDRDYCALFVLIFFLDMFISMFELYCALDGFGFNKYNEDSSSSTRENTRSRRGKRSAKSEMEKNQEIIMKGYQSLVRLILYAFFYLKWVTWVICILEIAIRYFFLTSRNWYKDIPNLIDVTFGSFIAFFYNKPLIHLFRFYGIFLRLYIICNDEKDIAVGTVEVKLEKCLTKLNKQKKILKQANDTIQKQTQEAKRLNDEIATLQQALFFAAKAAEDDTEYFFKALDEVGAFTPEAMDSIKGSINNVRSIPPSKNQKQKDYKITKSSSNSSCSTTHHHGHSHQHESHSHSHSGTPVVKGEAKRKFKIQSDGKMLEKK